MRFPIRSAKLLVVLAVSLLLSSSISYGAEKSALVELRAVSGSPLGVSTGSTVGRVVVASVTGPTGGTLVTVTVDTTAAGHTYALYSGRDGRTFRIIDFVTWITGTGGAVTVDGVQMGKAPTNGQSFLLADLTLGRVVAKSDPIKY